MSYECNACSVLVSQVCLRATHVHVGLRLHYQLNNRDTHMEKELLSCNVHRYQRVCEMRLSRSQIIRILVCMQIQQVESNQLIDCCICPHKN